MNTRAAGAEDRWTLHTANRALLGNKTGATRLGFAVLLKLFQAEGRFPRRPEDVPMAAVEAVAAQVGVPAAAWRGYDWHGRAIRYHRVQIRTALGFREATDEDAAAPGRWLTGQALALERRHDRLVAAARERCRALRLEPPSPERLERLVRSALHRQEEAFCTALIARLPPGSAAGLMGLVEDTDESHPQAEAAARLDGVRESLPSWQNAVPVCGGTSAIRTINQIFRLRDCQGRATRVRQCDAGLVSNLK